MAEVLLFPHGLSTSDCGRALEQFLNTGAGLSPAMIGRLTTQWQHEAKAFNDPCLAGPDCLSVRVDGIHLKVRLQQDTMYLPAMVGVRADGMKDAHCPGPRLAAVC
jgi:hypothetical protein